MSAEEFAANLPKQCEKGICLKRGGKKLSLRRNVRGATMVEAAIVLPLFLIVLILGIDLLRVSFNVLSLRFVAARVMRDVSIGTLNQWNLKNSTINLAQKFGTTIERNQISVCELSDYPCTSGDVDLGDPGDLLILEIRPSVQGFILSHVTLVSTALDIKVTVIGKREP